MIRIYNTLTKQKQEFKPLKKDSVSLYSCGATVQGRPHIGHMRAAVTADTVRRTMELAGYNVKSVYNFTDIDDKLIEKMAETGDDYRKIAEDNIRLYLSAMGKMNIEPFTYYPRATGHIQEIIELIESLIEKKHAYNADGNVYFSVSSDNDYGKLSGKRTEDLIEGKRVEMAEGKKHPFDFALWKKHTSGEPYWHSPFGKGRPGWHIECSAMSMHYLGETFDIHTGGEDLIFPHHENEIAQSECATGSEFARYWIHNGMVNMKGEKMSKSIGNVFEMSRLLKEYRPAVLRLYLYKTHYRKTIEFSSERLNEARSAYNSISNAMDGQCAESPDSDMIQAMTEELYDDFNTPRALKVIYDAVRSVNAGKNAGVMRKTIAVMTEKIGLPVETEGDINANAGVYIDMLIEARNRARKAGNYDIGDFIRNTLASENIELRDSGGRTDWKKKD